MSLFINHSLIQDEANYVGPPVVIQSVANRGTNSGSVTFSFGSTPREGDLILIFVTAGQATTAPTTVPSGFVQLTGYTHTLSNFVAYVYYKTAGSSESNSYTFSWVGGGSVCGTNYQIRYHNGFDVVKFNFRDTVGTTLLCGASSTFVKNSLGLAFGTCHNTTTSPYAFTNSYTSLLDATPSSAPTRGTASAVKTYLAQATESTTFSWVNSRYAISFLISVLSSNPA